MTHYNFAKLLIVLSISLIMSEAAAQISGVVVVGEKKCHKRDRIVITTNVGFTLAEQYGGSFDKDDTIVGELNSFGFKDVLVNGVAGRLWIDDFMASRNKAEKWCFGDR